MDELDSQSLFEFLRENPEQASSVVYDRYIKRLVALARARISSRLQRRLDAEDVVQSAYRSFFLHAAENSYSVRQAGDLWRILAATTLHKLYGQIERQNAAKRSMDRENYESFHLRDICQREPPIVEAVAASELLHLALSELSETQRFVLRSFVRGEDESHIAVAIGKSERTVRRLLKQAWELLEKRLLDSGAVSREVVRRPPTLKVNAPFSEYRMEKLVGAGAMGKVYRATHSPTGMTVAIKTLHKSRLQDPRAVDHLIREAELLSQLQHPHIVKLLGIGTFPSGVLFLVMEFLNGTSLQHQVDAAVFSSAKALSVLRQVATAVNYAHSHNILHCDLKPANVLRSEKGHCTVTDFGFARINSAVSASQQGSIGGTRGFLAPEVLLHRAAPTVLSDVYSLGALFWTLLVGKPPGREEDSLKIPTISVHVRDFCRRCLSSTPSDRFSSVGELIAAIDRLPDRET